MTSTTIRKIRNTKLFKLYQNLLTQESLDHLQSYALLKIAVMLLNDENENSRNLGYRIIVMYSNQNSDYLPLHDVALESGLMPVSRLLEDSEDLTSRNNSFASEFLSALSESYRLDSTNQTAQQIELGRFFRENRSKNVTVVAPTSYGKSELFSRFCRDNRSTSICIIVPTKALLAQTKRRLLEHLDTEDRRKIITHPEMYRPSDDTFIAILTQERLLRLLQTHSDAAIHSIFVDEAHNLLDGDQRNLLLAKVLVLLKARNPRSNFKFLTPFLVDENNIRVRYAPIEASSFHIRESIKTERFFLFDFRGGEGLQIYDQYFDTYSTPIQPEVHEEHELLDLRGGKKNIVYFNKPKHVERFAIRHAERLSESIDDELSAVADSISEYLDSEYNLVECIRKGVIYHHGSVPDIVKLYIEHIFSVQLGIRFIVTTSTLLEGVNIPAEKLFLLDIKKGNKNLSPSQFRNLVGRVCRFREVFHKNLGTPRLLEPEIYIVGTDEYLRARTNLKGFLKRCSQVDLTVKDEVNNILLEATEIDEKNENRKQDADEYLENLVEGITGRETRYTSTEIGHLCFQNNVSEIDIIEYETEMDRVCSRLALEQLTDANSLLEAIVQIFIPYLRDTPNLNVYRRLREESAQGFYSMFLSWRMRNASYSEMIRAFLEYWNNLDDPIVYVGRWGDIARDGAKFANWVDIRAKNNRERINLAIVRIKEEQDFTDNFLLKFIEILNELGKVGSDTYLRVKYGTTDPNRILMINNGINATLASLLISQYSQFVQINQADESLILDPQVLDAMRDNGENAVLTFEASFHVR